LKPNPDPVMPALPGKVVLHLLSRGEHLAVATRVTRQFGGHVFRNGIRDSADAAARAATPSLHILGCWNVIYL
jgi:hypothetical protein